MLRTIDGIVQLLQIETGKPITQIEKELGGYILDQKRQHPERHEINIARGYLVMKLQHDYRYNHTSEYRRIEEMNHRCDKK